MYRTMFKVFVCVCNSYSMVRMKNCKKLFSFAPVDTNVQYGNSCQILNHTFWMNTVKWCNSYTYSSTMQLSECLWCSINTLDKSYNIYLCIVQYIQYILKVYVIMYRRYLLCIVIVAHWTFFWHNSGDSVCCVLLRHSVFAN